MNPEKAEATFASILAACDDALAAGEPTPLAPSGEVPNDLLPRLERAVDWCRMVRRLLPVGEALSIDRTGIYSTIRPSSEQENRPTDTDHNLPSFSPAKFNRLGRFQIRRELGHGGAGIVFLAFDPKLGREVALKIARPEIVVMPELRKRFQQEARAAAVLDHPNVVPVYEAGEEQGICYIASAYCPGVTLGAWLRNRTEPVGFDEAARLIATLADAVEHAHRRGILHRDLKPGNVLLAYPSPQTRKNPSPQPPPRSGEGEKAKNPSPHPPPRSGEGEKAMNPTPQPPPRSGEGEKNAAGSLLFASGRGAGGEGLPDSPLSASGRGAGGEGLSVAIPRITDFGLAKLLDGAHEADATGSGTILGTPAYMAPEQAAGLSSDAGPAADVYALGVLLYEVLTGRPPFKADTVSETLVLVRNEEPLPPAKLRPRVPRDLETICLKCLYKDPRKRYASAQALAGDLGLFLAHKPITARPASRWERAVKWVRRRPALSALMAVSGAAVLAVAVILLTANERLRHQRDAADASRRQALAGYRKAREAVDQMLRRVGIDLLHYVPHTEVIQRELVEDALKFYQELAEKTNDDPDWREEQGIVYRAIGSLQSALGRKPAGEEAFRKALDIRRALADEFPGDVRYRHAIAVDEQNLGNFLVSVKDRPGAREEAEQRLLRARDVLAELAAEYPDSSNYGLHLASTLASLGDLMQFTGRIPEAEEFFGKATAIREKAAEKSPGDLENVKELARNYHAIGTRLAGTGEFAKAEPLLRRAVELSDRLAAARPDLPAYRSGPSPLLLLNLALLLRDTRRLAESEKFFLRALTYYEKLAADFPTVAEHRERIAFTSQLLANLRLYHLQQFQPARHDAERAIRYLLPLTQADPKNTVVRRRLRENYSLLAESLIRLGEHREAAATADKLPPLFPDAWQERLSAGWFLARCVPLLERDARLAESERQTLREDYAGRAVGRLREVVQRGWKDVEFLRKDPGLAAVRQREDFQKLLRELDKGGSQPSRGAPR